MYLGEFYKKKKAIGNNRLFYFYTAKLSPQPQVRDALGLLK